MNKSIYHSSDMHGADNTNHTNSNPTTYQASVTTKAANQIQDHNQNVSRHLWQQRQSTQAKTTTLMMSLMTNLIYVNKLKKTSSSETPKRKADLGQIAFKPSFTTRNRFPSPQAPLLTARPIYKPVMVIRATAHILAAMVEWGGVRIYSPCMSQHEGANISGGTCLMHGAMDVHWTLHSFHQTWKISAFLSILEQMHQYLSMYSTGST